MIPVARISKLFGREGEVILNLLAGFPDEFDPETEPDRKSVV